MEPAVCNPRVRLQAQDTNDMLCDDEKQAIEEMKRIYGKTITLDTKLVRDIYGLEAKLEAEHNLYYDERKKVLDGIRQRYKSDALAKNVSNFWLRVLKATYADTITDLDANVLCHLTDIRSKLYTQTEVKFDIYFHFESNDYFSNECLSKTYYLNCKVNPEEHLGYEGAEIYKTQGCTIDWMSETLKALYKESFFKFFSPPTLPEDPEDPTYKAINDTLETDFQFGVYLKERVIPKAVFYFTGEIKDVQVSSSETDDEDSNDSVASVIHAQQPMEQDTPNESDAEKENDEDDEESDDLPLYGNPALLDTEEDCFDSGESVDSGNEVTHL